jgi:hypothetical protein
VQETVAKIDRVLKEKHWHEFQVATLKLNLVPYFLFNYHYFVEKESSGQRLIEHSFDGVLVLDGHAIKIDEELTSLVKENWSRGSTAAPDVEYEEKWNNVDKKAQESIIQLKVAQHFNVPKSNVVITSIRRVLVPYYKASVTVKEGTFGITINAVSGDMSGIEAIPEREQGFMELTKETFNDLKKPSAWAAYSKGLALESGKAVKERLAKRNAKKAEEEGAKPAKADEAKGADAKSRINLSVLSTRPVIMLIILLALFLIYLAFFH